jgi:hypothetical protein
MFKIEIAIEPIPERIRNVVMIREKLKISTGEANKLYDGLVSKNIHHLDKKTIDSLIEIGWEIISIDEKVLEEEKIRKEEMNRFSKEADSWYQSLSDTEKKYVAYFQRMMIPTAS